ncbi:MAG: tRNA 2-selenouridine(34) synthase MnmH [Alphaproteobacteria bacterium]|nr:tRNA 2-selenouridine(34) synthase MnmH [Alphaproteobacteria bacterium]
MSLTTIPAAQAAQRLSLPPDHPQGFSAVIDARSEGEYALDCLPGAINWPSLNNEERVLVGTLYKQQGAFEAQKIGAALVAANVSIHIRTHVLGLSKAWRPLVYCWRGGKRSGSLAHILSQIGFQVTLIEGGYKAFRKTLVESLPQRVAPIRWRVICGPTGSGKTRLLHALQEAGAQVLDLEGLARHRSSVLGLIPGESQPSQKKFDSLLWEALGRLDPHLEVFVESESRKVGNVSIPEPLMLAMRASPCLRVEVSTELRVELLMQDYPFFVEDSEFFCSRMQTLIDLRGRDVVDGWCAAARAGQTREVVRQLLETHYDPGYAQSTRRNYSQFEQATPVHIHDISPTGLRTMALGLIST